MQLYRAMKAADDALPVTEATARGLGARPGVDIPLVDGMVAPATGGMSVTVNDPSKLPRHRLPARMGGEGRDPVFHLDRAQLPTPLVVRRDEPCVAYHAFVEPAQRCSFAGYQSDIQSTRAQWRMLR